MYVCIAKVTGVHGIKGHVKLQSFTSPPSNLLKFNKFFIETGDQQWLPVKLFDLKQQGPHFLAIIDDCCDRDVARKFNQLNLAVLRSELPKLDEAHGHYWADLEGLAVYNVDNKFIGHVNNLFETGSNDVLKVQNNNKEILIPYIPQVYVINVDLENKKIVVDWDENWL